MKSNNSAPMSVACLFVLVLFLLFSAACQDSAQANRVRLQAQVEEFSQLPREQLTEQPYIKGRAMIITKRQEPQRTSIEDPVYWGTDDAKQLMAESPEQVQSVVLLQYSKEAAGSYKVAGASGGVSAFREICEVVVIDRSIPAVIHRKTFRGPDPLSTTSISHTQAEVVSSVDVNTVRNYVLKLPRR